MSFLDFKVITQAKQTKNKRISYKITKQSKINQTNVSRLGYRFSRWNIRDTFHRYEAEAKDITKKILLLIIITIVILYAAVNTRHTNNYMK